MGGNLVIKLKGHPLYIFFHFFLDEKVEQKIKTHLEPSFILPEGQVQAGDLLRRFPLLLGLRFGFTRFELSLNRPLLTIVLHEPSLLRGLAGLLRGENKPKY